MPKSGCAACHGFGVIRLTAHFHTGDREWEAPCWECFGRDVKLALPSPQSSEM
jgi:DnaJ-class molecular chaperone